MKNAKWRSVISNSTDWIKIIYSKLLYGETEKDKITKYKITTI